MFSGFEDVQKFGQENVDAAVKSVDTFSKGFQAIALECADYSKKSFEEGSAAMEKLIGSKSLDKAFEVQSEYAKSAYEGLFGQVTKLGEMYADLAKDSYKPIEGLFSKASKK